MNATTLVERTAPTTDLIGLPQVATELGITRKWAWALYRDGLIEPVLVVGTEQRPRPMFTRQHIAQVKRKREAMQATKGGKR